MQRFKQYLAENPRRAYPTDEEHMQHLIEVARGEPSGFEKLLAEVAAKVNS